MIGFSKNGRFLELFPNTRISVDIESSLFANDAIPGLKVYTFDIPKSKANLRELGFASGLSNSVPDQPFLDKYILHIGNNGLLPYKQGYLKFRGADHEKLSYSFHSGAGEVNLQIKDKLLSQLTFGSYVHEYEFGAIYPEKNHTYVSMLNEDQFGSDNKENPLYINDFAASNISTVQGVLVPFPFLCFVVKTVCNQLGFSNVTGSWFEDERIRRIVMFNNYSGGSLIRLYADHLPDISVGDFLISLKNMFAIDISFESVSGTVRINWKKDIVNANASKEMTKSADPRYKFTPNETDGFTLSMAADSNDKLTAESSVPFTYQIGNGADSISSNASSIYEKHLNTFLKIHQAMGNNVIGKKPFGLRLMFYVGHKSYLGKSYPAGDYEYDGLSLAWDGENGLYNQAHKPWLDFLAETYSLDRTMNFNLLDLQSLDLSQKAMIQYNKFLFSKVRFSAGTGKQKIWPASTTMFRTKY